MHGSDEIESVRNLLAMVVAFDAIGGRPVG
jgi:hypothetical protein